MKEEKKAVVEEEPDDIDSRPTVLANVGDNIQEDAEAEKNGEEAPVTDENQQVAEESKSEDAADADAATTSPKEGDEQPMNTEVEETNATDLPADGKKKKKKKGKK